MIGRFCNPRTSNWKGKPHAPLPFNQPVAARGENKSPLELSVAEAGPACIEAGLITAEELDRTLAEMRRLNEDGSVLVVMPRIAQVWARKPAHQSQGAVVPQVAGPVVEVFAQGRSACGHAESSARIEAVRRRRVSFRGARTAGELYSRAPVRRFSLTGWTTETSRPVMAVIRCMNPGPRAGRAELAEAERRQAPRLRGPPDTRIFDVCVHWFQFQTFLFSEGVFSCGG
jgi:hypothetical protein